VEAISPGREIEVPSQVPPAPEPLPTPPVEIEPMRKSREETEQTRRRIVETAGVEFRRGGIANTGVADVMTAVGLTPGGFYRHFDSKESLVKESLGNSFDALRASIQDSMGRRKGAAALVAAIEHYLSLEHRDSPACCPFVSLGGELARETQAVRDTAAVGFEKLVAVIAQNLPKLSPAAAKNEAAIIASTMIGAMTVARLIPDGPLSASVLMQVRKSLFERVRSLA
jgi:TetR/AcrR family transcriptional repressor of nem operon